MHAAINQTRKMLILIGGVGFFLGMIGTVFLARRITKPLKKLVDGTVRISRGEFTHRIEIDSGDEVGDLARSFNEMSRDLLRTRERMEEANRRLIQAEKLASSAGSRRPSPTIRNPDPGQAEYPEGGPE
jgi:nitrogen fixation/metabolism regulation signal transduction histidine kinase